MTRISLILLFALSLLVSFSVQAGSGHHNKHHRGHHQKHQRHHNKHHGHHYYSHGVNRHRYRHDHYYSYYGAPQFHTVPQLAPGTRYAYSASGAVIVYQAYPYQGDHYGYDY